MKSLLRLREASGWALGYVLGIGTGLTSFFRRARTFHPAGTVLLGELTPISSALTDDFMRRFVDRLPKQAIVRFSGALWKKHPNWIDVLGCAIRFTDFPRSARRSIGDQDLLLATIKHPFTMPFAPFFTSQHDYLRNIYYAVSPFQVGDGGLIKIRAVPYKISFRSSTGVDRSERLSNALRRQPVMRVEFQALDRGSRAWRPLFEVKLLKVLDLDQEVLRFSPFHPDHHLRPRGFVHYLRIGAYRLSQLSRPAKR